MGTLLAKWGVAIECRLFGAVQYMSDRFRRKEHKTGGARKFVNQPQKSFGDLTLYIKSMTER
jgi:hypothetical protein